MAARARHLGVRLRPHAKTHKCPEIGRLQRAAGAWGLSLAKVGEAAEDWSGGTRIGHCLHEFNRFWARRVLGQGAVALLITDGLDRDGGEGLGAEVERLHKSCRRLIWLNPLLRYDGFAPKSQGIRTILPHVDDFRTIHNLESLADLTSALSGLGHKQEESVTKWLPTLNS